ncbi:type I-B CRISPR-associated protein Cas5b [Paramaledivibacter caminithermalis]|jgi:CRISPR-associated protein Cas5h|uniref:CRISPR-associated protein Cas5h n=1 Tax=Paramaledivibacter caminithermalis (strain DSM 15212 / CIP 107654 / DViRD3) TaxID=1121301 RepID=A0A1M6KPP3_PARC5|nr:type I-B CRISPR-associated protein Cas5b [Paramaledivibacter caminithermalis]SHJ60861.1 CRISPR-associated protein Cas5h [Paramaledivibacter caminithermalis DSM 15212]
MNKDILIFDIEGYGAHFRKFYTNSSSLSYGVPPRTVISGLIAGILGRERDTYYDDFAKEKIDIAVKKNVRIRKIMQTLNYMKITSPKHFQLPEDHTQIPFEIVLAEKGMLSYRIYLSHRQKSFIDELEGRIRDQKYYYAPFLGTATFSCSLKYVDRITGIEEFSQEPIDICSLVPFSSIEDGGIQLSRMDISKLLIMKEKMPCEFTGARNIKTVEAYVYDENLNPLSVLLKSSFVKLKYNEHEENIVFM